MTALPAKAAPNLVVNGGFDAYTGGLGELAGYFAGTTVATGWSNRGYNYLMNGTVDDNGGVNGSYGNLQLWGPGNGSNNGLAESMGGTGGNYVAADGARTGALYQSISGLVAGTSYAVTFDWAAAQQTKRVGPTTEAWLVSLDNTVLATNTDPNALNAYTQSTGFVSNASKGFVPWTTTSMIFTARDATQVLSFLAAGTPDGEPPFSLIDNISMAAVPEASTWAMMILGFGAIGAAARRNRAVPQPA